MKLKLFRRRRNRWLALGSFLGALMLLGGMHLHSYKNVQAEAYNAGLVAYQAGDMEKAVQLFDRSVDAYRSAGQANALDSAVYPQPDRALAALADFQKAKALLQLKKAPAAVDALKESLALNPGNGYKSDISAAEAERLAADARFTQYDLELLFKNNPDQAKQQGKGKGNPGKPSDKQLPGTEPGDQPGKGDRNNI